jgi:hypothetical protein
MGMGCNRMGMGIRWMGTGYKLMVKTKNADHPTGERA